jgi:acyl-CoA synthetase (AMP-forming)/AMP-acid ligase II
VISAGGLWQLIERRAQATPDALFAVDENDRELSFAEYRSRAERCAAGLAGRGVVEGTRVSWQLPTSLESMVLAAALARLGAVQNPILPIYREREVGMAFVVPAPGASPSAESVGAWCREHMANYKVPRRIEIVDALPLNAAGKVMKFVLRERASENSS